MTKEEGCGRILIFTGGSLDLPYLGGFLREISYERLICADRGLLGARALGLRPDLVLGDFDSLPAADREWLFQNADAGENSILVRTYPVKKDETDTELALREALQESPGEIWVFGALGSRLDHVLGNLQLLFQAEETCTDVIYFDPFNKIYLVKDHHEIQREKQYGSYVSLIPLFGAATVSLTGFLYPLQAHCLEQGNSLGISNQITEEVGDIFVHSGCLLVIESRDEPWRS